MPGAQACSSGRRLGCQPSVGVEYAEWGLSPAELATASAGHAVPCRASAPPAGLGQGVILGDVRGHIHSPQSGHMIAAVIGLVLADRDPATSLSGLALE
jgi:hypothetical protein